MIDLHDHTNHSDGTDGVVDVLKKAEELRLEMIAITDHDNVDVYDEIATMDMKNIYSGKLLSGVELKTAFDGVPVEILAYGVDTEKMKKTKCVDDQRKIDNQNKYLRNYIAVGKGLGIRCDENIEIKDFGQFAAVAYFDEICKYDENYRVVPELLGGARKDFYRNTMGNKKSPFYVDESKDSVEINELIEIVHDCGGKAFLAHLFEYRLEDHLGFLGRVIDETEIDGIECFYSMFTPEQTEAILRETRARGKYVSGGSDYHGANKKGVELGAGKGDLNVSYEVVKDWAE